MYTTHGAFKPAYTLSPAASQQQVLLEGLASNLYIAFK